MAAVDLTPLDAIRVRTPRLELRVGSRAELVALRELARRGIHPPEVMPFYVPWTDWSDQPGWIVDYHEQLRAEWRAENWTLELLVWAADELAGTQSLRATDFASRRTIDTGSWLGSRFQGQGYGTEMRTGALELAFRGLGAELVTSGSFDDNPASIRVSEKLGYRAVGEAGHAPRGTPQREIKFELHRDEWDPPVPVEIEGLEAALPLFGL